MDTLPEDYAAGYGTDKEWCRGVLDNVRRTTVSIKLEAGDHKLRFIHINAGVILQKIDIGLSESECYYGYKVFGS